MTGAEKGILMLTCPLGEQAQTLTPRQFYGFRRRVMAAIQQQGDEELTVSHLTALGLPEGTAKKILALLEREERLESYLSAGQACGITAVTRASAPYPDALETKLGPNAPAALFCLWDVQLLQTPFVARVGSRKLHDAGRRFAETVGTLAAKESYTLVSGGAVGADSAAQQACLQAGGSVIVFTPERLLDVSPGEHVLYCSEGGYDHPFSAQRALSRNRLIHALAEKTFVAQCDGKRGGTWRGSLENLQKRYSDLFVFSDGGEGTRALVQLGAEPVTELISIRDLQLLQMEF